MVRRINVIADDYGLSPGIGNAVRELIARGKITGTSCMTLFPEWTDQAKLLRHQQTASRADVGLHLTLTDFVPLSHAGRGKKMPALFALIVKSYLGLLDQKFIDGELDAQLERFVEDIGQPPDFIDGHQHVHFLPAVRHWLDTRRHRFEHCGRLPWLRGAPQLKRRPDTGVKLKIAFVSLLAAGFDRRMTAAGFPVRGPLIGFYDWKRPRKFLDVIDQLESELPEDTVVMCHPGLIDGTLTSRDAMIHARPVEFNALAHTSGPRRSDFDPVVEILDV